MVPADLTLALLAGFAKPASLFDPAQAAVCSATRRAQLKIRSTKRGSDNCAAFVYETAVQSRWATADAIHDFE